MSLYSFLRLEIKKICVAIVDTAVRYKDYLKQKNIDEALNLKDGAHVYISSPSYLLGLKYMSVGKNFSSLPGMRIECIDTYDDQHFSPKLIIGDGVSFNYYCHVGCINKIVIGNHVMVGSYVLITDHSHGELERTSVPVAKRKLLSKGPVIIEDNVWIGEHACIMPGVTIGKGSIIGANAVVTHDVPPFSVAVGVPARVVYSL